MRLSLYRNQPTPLSIPGKLFADDGKQLAFTLENAKAAILAGVYPIELRPSPKFERFAQTDSFWEPYAKAMPHIIGALPASDPRLELIMLHPANYWYEVDGCVAPGETQGVNSVGASRAAFQKVYPLITAALQSTDGCSIAIYDPHGQPQMGVDESTQV